MSRSVELELVGYWVYDGSNPNRNCLQIASCLKPGPSFHLNGLYWPRPYRPESGSPG